jgi:uncharacterized RDD family membrane protein YckC
MKYFLKRASAYLIDCIICYSVVMLVVQWAILSNFREQFGITENWFHNSINMELYVLITISLPVWVYFTLLDSKRFKGTFGKRLCKLTVYNDATEDKLEVSKSFFRTFLKLLPWEVAHLGIIFPTPMYFTKDPAVRFLTIAGGVLFALYATGIFLTKKTANYIRCVT